MLTSRWGGLLLVAGRRHYRPGLKPRSEIARTPVGVCPTSAWKALKNGSKMRAQKARYRRGDRSIMRAGTVFDWNSDFT
jgi:hypothetical protein